jgi:hypothetical protein
MNLKAKKRWMQDISKYDIPHIRLRQIALLVNKINPSVYVDLGCAKGTLRTLTPGINYLGCDFAFEDNNQKFEFYNCDFNTEKLPIKLCGMPLYTCSGLLEYIENIDVFLEDIYNAVINDGYVIISYFNMNHISRIFGMLKGDSFQVHPDWRGFHSPINLKNKLMKVGFRIQQVYPTSHGFYKSKAVEKTVTQHIKMPQFRFYSYILAHQLIYVCRK